ncbi:hypothetical protein AVEN_55211-1 [Araneus ventricosus]|uniref:Uncharacterized protein n=1 Tax=Araneus ventricosus TaxID=182803 RepID=A0A4Y2G574_ARAVE|nr:hypothetical protein AVEN_55211-1 [Araneus ventricosus]
MFLRRHFKLRSFPRSRNSFVLTIIISFRVNSFPRANFNLFLAEINLETSPNSAHELIPIPQITPQRKIIRQILRHNNQNLPARASPVSFHPSKQTSRPLARPEYSITTSKLRDEKRSCVMIQWTFSGLTSFLILGPYDVKSKDVRPC